MMSSDLAGYDYNVAFTKSVLVEGAVDQTPKEGQTCSVEVKALFDPALLVVAAAAAAAMTTPARAPLSAEQLIGFAVGRDEPVTVRLRLGYFTSIVNSVIHKALLQMRPGELAHLSFEIEPRRLDESLQDSSKSSKSTSSSSSSSSASEVSVDVKFQLTLIEIEGPRVPTPNVYTMSDRALYDLCVEHKQDAARLYQAGFLATAFQRYRKAMSYLIIIEHQREYVRSDDQYSGIETPADSAETAALLADVRVIKSQLFANLAVCQLKSKNYDMAIVNCTKCLALDAGNVKALFRRGQAYLGRNDFDEAIRDLNAALALDTDNKEIAHKLQLAEQAKKRYEQAMSANFKKIFA